MFDGRRQQLGLAHVVGGGVGVRNGHFSFSPLPLAGGARSTAPDSAPPFGPNTAGAPPPPDPLGSSVPYTAPSPLTTLNATPVPPQLSTPTTGSQLASTRSPDQKPMSAARQAHP